jgi:hypothetical protein
MVELRRVVLELRHLVWEEGPHFQTVFVMSFPGLNRIRSRHRRSFVTWACQLLRKGLPAVVLTPCPWLDCSLDHCYSSLYSPLLLVEASVLVLVVLLRPVLRHLHRLIYCLLWALNGRLSLLSLVACPFGCRQEVHPVGSMSAWRSHSLRRSPRM